MIVGIPCSVAKVTPGQRLTVRPTYNSCWNSFSTSYENINSFLDSTTLFICLHISWSIGSLLALVVTNTPPKRNLAKLEKIVNFYWN